MSRIRPPGSGLFQPVADLASLGGARLGLSTGPRMSVAQGPKAGSTYVVRPRPAVLVTRKRVAGPLVTRRRAPGRITARPQIE